MLKSNLYMHFLVWQKLLIPGKKDADVSRNPGVRQMIYVFFGSSLDQVQLCQISSL